MEQTFSWIVTILGLIGFWLAGKKLWWSWYINIVNQIAWVIFAIITNYYAFLVGTAFYFAVFSRNAYLWTREHFESRGTTSPQVSLTSYPFSYLRPYCGNVSDRWRYACVKPGGHDGKHGFAGIFWTDEEGTWAFKGRVVVNPPQYCEYSLVEKPDGSSYGACLIDHIHIGHKQE